MSYLNTKKDRCTVCGSKRDQKSFAPHRNQCKECRLLKNKERYHRDKEKRKDKRKSYYKANQEYTKNKTRKYYRNNTDKVKEREIKLYNSKKEEIQRNRKLKKYNISLEEYNQLIEKTQGRCYICNEIPISGCVDHDHDTGKVRGYLCKVCNSGIGLLKDNILILQNAVKYLRDHDIATEDINVCVYYSGAKRGVLPT